MAHELWIMDYDQIPRPLEDADGEVDLSVPITANMPRVEPFLRPFVTS